MKFFKQMMIVFCAFVGLSATTVTLTGCGEEQENSIEEASEEIQDEVDDAT